MKVPFIFKLNPNKKIKVNGNFNYSLNDIKGGYKIDDDIYSEMAKIMLKEILNTQKKNL